ncbi:hypothetical protein C8R45DRAFT_1186475 [Mycena sanguinolenta]|nr:hypothetical protein C8R45DRAFT_1186475 [Mycena sanguinolenta]
MAIMYGGDHSKIVVHKTPSPAPANHSYGRSDLVTTAESVAIQAFDLRSEDLTKAHLHDERLWQSRDDGSSIKLGERDGGRLLAIIITIYSQPLRGIRRFAFCEHQTFHARGSREQGFFRMVGLEFCGSLVIRIGRKLFGNTGAHSMEKGTFAPTRQAKSTNRLGFCLGCDVREDEKDFSQLMDARALHCPVRQFLLPPNSFRGEHPKRPIFTMIISFVTATPSFVAAALHLDWREPGDSLSSSAHVVAIATNPQARTTCCG